MEKNEYKTMYNLEKDYWWFVGKQKIVNLFLMQYFRRKIKTASPILDIGCGTGKTLNTLNKFGKGFGIEISKEALIFLKYNKTPRIIQTDVNGNLPIKNNTFSAVTCLDVLEHVENDDELIAEILRVCKYNGHILITVPAFNLLWSRHDVSLHHKRRYRIDQLIEMFSNYDVEIVKSSYFNFLLFVPILLFRKLSPLFYKNPKTNSDLNFMLPKWVNETLKTIYLFEIFLLKKLRYPFGVSLMIIIKKNER